MLGRIGQVYPAFGTLPRTVLRDAVRAAHRRDAFASPAVAVAGFEVVAIEDGRNYVIGADACKNCNRLDRVGAGMGCTLSTATSRYPEAGVNTALPVDDHFDLTCILVDVHEDFRNQRANDSLLEARVRVDVAPRSLQLSS